MNWLDIRREAGLILSKKSTLWLLLAALLLSVFSVITGSLEVAQQRATIERLLAADQLDRQAVLEQQKDYGGVAYYSLHLTYAPPSELSFAAHGVRDVYPWKHRIRMLALEGQIYESDTENPELALAGRIDFVFVISVLAPLLVILLLHDLRASERAAGRLDLLIVTAHRPVVLWPLRATLLLIMLSLTLLVPFWLAALVQQVSLSLIMAVSLLCLVYLTCWALLCYWLAKRPLSASMLASSLLGIWLLTSFIVPAVANVVIDTSVHGPEGGDILMVQREAVNDAWDLPFSDTMDAFVATHPQWREHTQMHSLFEWKWYYAFQQVGDQQAQALSNQYRAAAERKYQLAGWVAMLSPATLMQRMLTRWAQTDAVAARVYEQRVRAFHAQLRHFYYPLLFNNPSFEPEVLNKRPEFIPFTNQQSH
jgi:ABC-2 type transport system permease protein